ncbi:MAG: hypothetical protein IKO68_10900 [Oscillospiraceae bacterium]|nr:hypothetical protein [Oscillospiraceae bacterium]
MSEQSPEKVNTSEAPAETYSLASILSEYKSEAFIRNERRYSKEELEKRADEIIREMKRSVEAELSAEEDIVPETENSVSEAPSPEPGPAPEDRDDPREEEPVPEPDPKTDPSSGFAPASSPSDIKAPDEAGEQISSEEPSGQKGQLLPQDSQVPKDAPEQEPPSEEAEEEEEAVTEQQGEETPSTLPEDDVLPKSPEQTAESESESAAAAIDAAERAAAKKAEKWEKRAQRSTDRLEKSRRKKQQQEERKRKAQEKREEARREQPEPSPEEALRLYASGIASLQSRRFAAFALCAVMALALFLHSRGILPGALRSGTAFPIILAALQLVVMLLGLDILTKGITDLFSAKPGCESIVLIANLAAEIDAVWIIAAHPENIGLPYCVTAAASLAFALWGAGCRRSAFRDTIRSMRLASVPTVVSAEDKLAEEGAVLNKRLGSSRGFLRRCLAPDLGEQTYRRITPALLLLLLILALAAAYLSGTGAVLHCLAAICCAAAALTSTLVFSRPFALIARKLSGNGAALAGWSGAEDMNRAVGIVIRDLDVFPENTVILNGMKVLSGAHVEKVVAYTGSVILATGSGLRRVFGELMRQYAAPLYRVEDFDCGIEGGVSAFVGAEQVLIGTAAYMNLMGIRVPGNVDVGGAVYTAIDHELCGVFVVGYTPLELVQNALIRLEDGKIRPLLALRDFNFTPAMLEQKFRLEEGSVSFLPPEDRYRLSVEPEEGEPAALLSREGLWHFSETARGGRRLYRTTRRALWMTLIGAVLGIAITFIACARGSFSSVAPGKLLVSMLLWAFATMMIADSADGD